MQYCMDLNLLTPALLQKCNLNIQKASGYILYGHVLSSIMEFPSGVGSMMSMSVTFFEIFCKVVNLSQPNIGNYALEYCNYSSALLFLKKGSIQIFFKHKK